MARNAGILMAHVFPQGGVVGGHASAMRLDGWTVMDRTANADAGVIVHWPMMEPVQTRWQQKTADEQRKDRDKAVAAIDRFYSWVNAQVFR